MSRFPLGMALLDLLQDSQTDTGPSLSNNISQGSRGDGGRVRAHVRMSQRPVLRAEAADLSRCARRTRRPTAVGVLGRPGRVCARAWRWGCGRPRSGGAPTDRGYGALAQDAPSPPGGPPARPGALPAAGPWPCPGAPPGWLRPISSSAASVATRTCRNSAPRSNTISRMSVPRARMRNSKRHDDHRAATKVATRIQDKLGTGDRPRTPSAVVPGAAWRPGSWCRDGRYAQLMWLMSQTAKPWSWRSGEPLWPPMTSTPQQRRSRTCWRLREIRA